MTSIDLSHLILVLCLELGNDLDLDFKSGARKYGMTMHKTCASVV